MSRHEVLRLARAAALIAGVLTAIAASAGGVFPATKHGDPLSGAQRLADEPRGECAQCHDQHASRLGVRTSGPNPFLLFAPDDNQLCATCHGGTGVLSIWPGATSYAASAHATAGGAAWPGPVPPGRPSADAGKCVNCHDPHGTSDASGLIPAMTFAREEALCNGCHGGSPASANVAAQFQKIYRHPVATAGKHQEGEAGDPSRYAASPVNNRHSECADCHNPHMAAADRGLLTAPSASYRLLGTGRVRVTNGAAGSKPSYTWAGPGDPSPLYEYQLCFKCHSSWTTLPAGQSDFGVLLNENNPSFHPVEAQGKNRNIAAGSFVNGWTWDRQVFCSDCHASDDTTVRGPHGSAYPHILKKPYTVSTLSAPPASTDLCFDCHTFDTYANDAASSAVKAYSRFNPGGAASGHTFHVGAKQVTCSSCHVTHGSPALPALVSTRRSPGFTAYTQNATGGTCTTSCHAPRAYTVAYPR